MKNKDVIKSWANGNKARGSNLKTDGVVLMSYDLIIGYKDSKNQKMVYNYTGKNSVSKTTARHVGQSLPHADGVVNPYHSK